MNTQQLYFNEMVEAMMDELPEPLEFCTPFEAGQLDAMDLLTCDPLRHGLRTVTECEMYIIGFKAAHVREPAIEDDHDWIRGGC